MPDVESTLDFIADNPIYKTERPYILTPPGGALGDNSDPRYKTVQLVDVPVTLHDIRGKEDSYILDKAGFEIVPNVTRTDLRSRIHDLEVRDEYARETEQFLRQELNAEHVHCYNVKAC